MNKADLEIIIFFTAIGIPFARFVINSTFSLEYMRKYVFK